MENLIIENKEFINLWKASDEWLQIHKYIFLRKETAQYLIDKKELIIFMLSKNGTQHSKINFETNIYHENELCLRLLLPTETVKFYEWNTYQNYFLKAKMDLEKLIKTNNWNLRKIEIKFYIKSLSKDIYNQEILNNAKIKYYRDQKKNHTHTILCVEPLYLDTSKFSDFRWWVELAKMSGYKKIAIYNNSIENNKLFNDYIEENKDFLDIHQFNYLPDFINNTYARSVNDLIKGPKNDVHWNFYQVYFLATDAMAYHDCLFKYSDEFKYIVVQDNDELVIPNRLKSYESYHNLIRAFEENRAKDLCDERSGIEILEDYLLSLEYKYTIPKNFSLYFQSVYYMNSVTAKDLIYMLQDFLIEAKQTGKKYPVALNFIDKIHKDFVYFYTISDETEYSYVVEMVEFYQKVLEPFLKKNENIIKNLVDNFDEIFLMSRKLTVDLSFGKSFNNPDSAMITSPHFPNSSYATLNEELHFLSHFRRRNNKLKNINASITNIKIDMNYLICYYIPIFEKLTK